MAGIDLSENYGEQYYQGYYERSPKWFRFFGNIADCLVEQFSPKRHLDAGCAWGLLVEMLRERGVESFGIDFSSYALAQVHPDIQPYCRRASLTEPIKDGPYDLVSCIEVLEHMEEADALQAIENLTAVTEIILFSSTPYDFDDPTHINVQPLLYWLRAFAKHGFYPIPGSDAAFLAEHAFLLRKSTVPSSDDALIFYAELIELRAQRRRMAQELEERAAGGGDSAAQAENGRAFPDEQRDSGAWQLIHRYHSWRGEFRAKSPRLFRVWESMAQSSLRLLGVGSQDQAGPMRSSWDYSEWIAQNEPSQEDLQAQEREAQSLTYRPKISVVTPVYEIPAEILREAIASVQAQTYDNWELCVSVIPTLNPQCAALLQKFAADDARIRICSLEANLGISGNSQRALEYATGEFVALLDHDDTLAPFALFEIASLLNEDPSANFIYSDRDEISADGGTRSNPFFKPGWSPDMLVSANFLTHLCVMRTEHVRSVGGWRAETDGAQDWDLFRRVTSRYGGVRHIPKILYHWRHASSSVSVTGLAGKPYAREAQVRTIASCCRDANLKQSVAFIDGNPKIVWRLNDLPRVTVVVVSRTMGEDTAEAAKAISRRPECEGAEVVCAAVDMPTQKMDGVTFVWMPAGVDIVGQTNRLVGAAGGEVLVFVDAVVRLESSEWLREIVGPLLLPGVGLCGCLLVDHRSDAVRQLGIAFDAAGDAVPVRPRQMKALFLEGWHCWLRNWSAASGACFAIQRKTWDEAGGFAAANGHSRPDIRLCLKLAERGLRVVINPAAQVRQDGAAALETPMRPQGNEDRRIIRGVFPQGDPYVNPNLHLVDGILVPR